MAGAGAVGRGPTSHQPANPSLTEKGRNGGKGKGFTAQKRNHGAQGVRPGRKKGLTSQKKKGGDQAGLPPRAKSRGGVPSQVLIHRGTSKKNAREIVPSYENHSFEGKRHGKTSSPYWPWYEHDLDPQAKKTCGNKRN